MGSGAFSHRRTTMLTVGLFAVLSWDSLFPDRRDVLVLSPLPVRARTIFLAKVAAVGTALGLTVVALNIFPSGCALHVRPRCRYAAAAHLRPFDGTAERSRFATGARPRSDSGYDRYRRACA